MTEPAHTCHARGCSTHCPPKHLMCKRHWGMVPPELQQAVWGTYQPGQERGGYRPTKAWHEAADAAIEAVYQRETKARMRSGGSTKRTEPRGPTLIEKRFGKK